MTAGSIHRTVVLLVALALLAGLLGWATTGSTRRCVVVRLGSADLSETEKRALCSGFFSYQPLRNPPLTRTCGC
jgi:hypothetical protein